MGNAYDSLKAMLNKINSVQTEIMIIHRNREEIYRISRMLPEMEGYKMMSLYDESMKNLHEAWLKLK